jgi:Na+/H+-translocating membrane pyrophosphatase
MELIIAIGLPILIGLLVFAFFQRDLGQFREIEKLKVGEVEALVRRHRLALMLHFAALLIVLPLMIFSLSNFALLGAILLGVVFLGHVTALSRLSRPLIAALQLRNEYRARLMELDEEEKS